LPPACFAKNRHELAVLFVFWGRGLRLEQGQKSPILIAAGPAAWAKLSKLTDSKRRTQLAYFFRVLACIPSLYLWRSFDAQGL